MAKDANYWADWLVDAVATATQDRRFLRGDPAEDKIATEAILLNGKKAIELAFAAAAEPAPTNSDEKNRNGAEFGMPWLTEDEM